PIGSARHRRAMPGAGIAPVGHTVISVHLKLATATSLHPNATCVEAPRSSLHALGLTQLPYQRNSSASIGPAIIATLASRFAAHHGHRSLRRLSGIIRLCRNTWHHDRHHSENCEELDASFGRHAEFSLREFVVIRCEDGTADVPAPPAHAMRRFSAT